MPKFDKTGPMGAGPGTGRGFGPCVNNWGCRGYGFRRFASPKNELASLEDQEKILEQELAIIREEKKVIKDQTK